jgi:hypothetical protein
MRPPRVGRAQDVNIEFSDFHVGDFRRISNGVFSNSLKRASGIQKNLEYQLLRVLHITIARWRW